MRIPKSFADIVRVLFVIDVFMMAAVVRGPSQHTVFKRRRAKQQGGQTHWPLRLESLVGKKPVITERDAQSGRDEETEKQDNLEEIDALRPDVVRHHSQAG